MNEERHAVSSLRFSNSELSVPMDHYEMSTFSEIIVKKES